MSIRRQRSPCDAILMKTVIVIPARYGSSRFPGKPLALVAGVSLIERVHRIAASLGSVRVLVATDDERIAEHVRAFGGEAVMTSAACRNGTERALAALEGLQLAPDFVVNLQGDAVLTPPWVLSAVIGAMQNGAMQNEASPAIATPCVRLTWEEYDARQAARARGEVGGTTVVRNCAGDALYFSKETIPLLRKVDRSQPCPVFRHIGLYAYRFEILQRYLTLEESALECCEGLEQLRALEHGIPIRCVEVDYRGRAHASIDNPGDIEVVERLLAEGRG